MRFPVCALRDASAAEFIDFWSSTYTDDDKLYYENIDGDLTAQRIRKLFVWKNSMRLSGRKATSIESNFIGPWSMPKAPPAESEIEVLLDYYSGGGPIWRIFWLHCLAPQRFLIYDQHVHRAMTFIQNGSISEIAYGDASKIEDYKTRYIPFHATFERGSNRSVDKALWAFGRFLLEFPGLVTPGSGS